jgi:S-DNA-T family DNA segregation ATPase FtsK/SpoIIIE
MNYTQRILRVLNKPIKDGEMKWTYDKHRKVLCGWEIGFNIPQHSSYEAAVKYLPALIATCGTEVELIGYKGLLVVRIIEVPMKTKIPFKMEMLEGLQPGELLVGFDVLGDRHTFNWELPHGIIAGETGMGKTDLIRLCGLCLLRDPNQIDIRIIDLKSLSFLPFRNIPNVSIGIDLNDAYKMLKAAAAEVVNRNKIIQQSGSRSYIKGFKKIVVIVDEAADLSPSIYKDKTMKAYASEMERFISTIARMGREVKIHLLYCTQYPTAQILSSQIKINCGMRICFYVPTPKNSEVVLEKSGAEELHAIPGRAIFKKNLYATIQVPYVGNDDVWSRLLAPYKMEVIEDGNSKRSEPQRTHHEGSFTNADSPNGSDSQTIYKRLTIETSKREPERTRETKVDSIRLALPVKGVEVDRKRTKTDGGCSDEI